MKKSIFLIAATMLVFAFNACTQEAPKEEVQTNEVPIMKCEPGKCGDAMLETAPEPMKCEAGKCGANM